MVFYEGQFPCCNLPGDLSETVDTSLPTPFRRSMALSGNMGLFMA